MRYVLALYLISGLIFSIYIFNYLIALEKNISPANPDVEYVFRQIPDVYFDGNYITTQAEMPLFIYDKDNRKIAAIDLKKELSLTDRNKLFVVFNDSYMQLPVKMGTTNGNNMNAEYKYLFGTESFAITSDTIGSFLPKIWNSINKSYIYILMPLVGLVYFAAILLYNIPYAIFVWLISYFWDFMNSSSGNARSGESFQVFDIRNKGVTSLQTAYRMTMFASGSSVFLQPLLFIINPSLSPIGAGASLASWIFMIMGMVKFKRGR